MGRIGLIVGLLVLIGALFVLNNGIHKNAQTDADEQQAAAAQEQQRQKAPAPVVKPKAAIAPPEEKIGNPAKAKYRITVGWTYDAANVAHPVILTQALDVVRNLAKAHPKTVSAVIADVDVPAKNRSPAARAVTGVGLAVNGKLLGTGTMPPGEEEASPDHYQMMLRPYGVE